MDKDRKQFIAEVGGRISLEAKRTIVFLFAHPHGDLTNLVEDASANLVWPVADDCFFCTYGPGPDRKNGLAPFGAEEVLRLAQTRDARKASGFRMMGGGRYSFEKAISAALAHVKNRAPMRIVICSCDAANASAKPEALGVIPGDEVIFLARLDDPGAASSFAATMQQAAPWAAAMTSADLRKVGVLAEALELSGAAPAPKMEINFSGRRLRSSRLQTSEDAPAKPKA